MIYIILSVLAVLFLTYTLVLVFPGLKRKRTVDFENYFTDYAHRGLWGDGAPENSLAAFSRAAERGFGIELDVRLSKDKTVYVFHDEKLKRMTGVDRKLSELTDSEIEELRLLNTGEKIPTFKEVLSLVDGRIPIMVELKGETFDDSVCVEADKLLKEYSGPYCIESFNPFLVGWYRKNRPEIMRGQLVDGKIEWLSALCSSLLFNIYNRPDFISYDFKRYYKFSLWLATHLWSARRTVWTIKSESDRKTAMDSGANVIFEGFIPDRKE